MAYTQKLSKRDSGILKHFAWGMGKPMATATIELLEYLPHIVDKKAVCGKCKDKSFSKQCVFFGRKKR
ncbi:MAG: hypothetical protein ABUK01_15545 [Leptospirales bacterium]